MMIEPKEENSNIVKVDGVVLEQPNDDDFNNSKKNIGVPEAFNIRNVNGFITFEKTGLVPGADAATSTLYPIFYVPNVRCFFIEARMRHNVNGGANAAVRIEKLPNGTLKGAGESMTDSAFTLVDYAGTTQRKTTTTVLASVQLGPGDAVALRASGTLTSAADVAVTVLFGIHLKDIPVGQSATTILAGV